MGDRLSWLRCVHLPIFAWYLFTLIYYLDFTELNASTAYGGRWRYLTYMNLLLQTGFPALCVLTNAVSRDSGLQSLLVKSRDFLFTVFVFPYGTFVTITFWGIYAIDRELVYPTLVDDILPSWMNHALHTVIVPLVLVQMYAQNHVYASRCKSVTVLWFSLLLLCLWVHWVHYATGIWIYLVFAEVGLMGIALIWGAGFILLYLLFLLGEKLSARMVQFRASEEKVLKRS